MYGSLEIVKRDVVTVAREAAHAVIYIDARLDCNFPRDYVPSSSNFSVFIFIYSCFIFGSVSAERGACVQKSIYLQMSSETVT